MRADRLLTILLHLQARGRTSSRDLAERLEVSPRTIHRDMDALSAAGIPVYAERGAQGGWELAEGYRTNLTGMTREEIMSLMMNMKAGPGADLSPAKDLDSALLKLLASLPSGHRHEMEMVRDRLHVDRESWNGKPVDVGPATALLRRAIWDRKMISFQYQKNDELVDREAGPLGLVAKQAKWYLVAHTERGVRVYLVRRIRAPKITQREFTRPDDFDLARYWERHTTEFLAGFSSFAVRLRIREERLRDLRRVPFVKIITISEPDAGRLQIEVDFERRDLAMAVLPGLGSSAEVLEPLDLRESLLNLADEIRNMYS